MDAMTLDEFFAKHACTPAERRALVMQLSTIRTTWLILKYCPK